MNTNAQKWVAALRSGEFHQVCEFLKTDKGYCALGVACALFLREGNHLRVEEKEEKDLNELLIRVYTFNDNCRQLPAAVRRWLGLNTRFHVDDFGQSELSSENDDGFSFAEIANIIESEPKGLFEAQPA